MTTRPARRPSTTSRSCSRSRTRRSASTADNVLPDQLPLAAGGRGGGADRARRAAAVRAGPGRRDRQPQRLDAARARGGRGRGDRARPPRGRRRGLRRDPVRAGVLRGRPLHARRHPLRGRHPVAETEFARDATFGYRSSNLRDFVREKVGDDARRWEIVNAESYEDLDAVVREARASGRRFLYRTGPSFVRALAGIEPIAPLTDVGRARRARAARRRLARRAHDPPGRGRRGPARDRARRHRARPRGRRRAGRRGLADRDVLLYTSRELVRGDDPLATARRVSAAVTQVVRRALDARRAGSSPRAASPRTTSPSTASDPPRDRPRPAPPRHGERVPAGRRRRARGRDAVRRLRRQRRRRGHAGRDRERFRA